MKKCLLFMVALWMLSCSAPVRITNSWAAPTAGQNKFDTIMVLSLAPQRFTDAARMGEDEMVAQLKAKGINAVSAQAKFGPLAFRDLDEEAAVSKIQETGADAVMVMSLLDLQKETRW